MKKTLIILVMLLTAATAYNQSSRRNANSNTAGRTVREAPATTKKTAGTQAQRNERDVAVKTKTTDRRIYHHDQNTPVRSTVTQSKSATTAHRSPNNNTTTTTSGRTVRTATVKETHRPEDVRVNRNRTGTNHTDYSKHREAVAAPSRPVTYHHEYSSPRIYRERHTVVHHYHHAPAAKVYRATYYPYRRPAEINIIWTPVMHRHYVRMYPMVTYWHYTNGYRIGMISAYEADYYRGEVMTVYGRVQEVYYSYTTDEYFLYFGLYYPHQDFTVILPGYIAHRYSRHPQQYFEDRHLAVTGLITTFNGEPEIAVKESFQIRMY